MTHICHTALIGGANLEETLRMIKKHCAEKLESTHQPELFRFYDDALPVAPSGKLNVNEMKENTDHLVRL